MNKQKMDAEQIVTLRDGGRETRVQMKDGVILLPKDFKIAPRRRRALAKSQSSKTAPVNVLVLKDVPEYGPQAMTQRLVGSLGSNVVAALLGVNKDRPSRWASGQDSPNEENRVQLADLDSLVGHLHTAFTPEQAKLWLEGHDSHLNARPIDVYLLEGAAPVIEAIRAHEQGAYA